ncbi:ligand-gated channel protein [Pasteurellaceae bacterium 15-036681]|nr:ligand-gated channel protein [Pasteurellaceae bacterium 15-036681]
MNKQKTVPIIVLVGVFGSQTVQSEGSAELSEVKVVAQQEQSSGEIKKTRRVIQDELIADTKDLVRYTTDVGVSDNGRHIKGFAMRGVEGNRVGVSIDGVSMPDFEENSLYARYGNFNSSRIMIDPELTQGIDLMRGADSFNSGSGSLGGGVNYRTLDSSDLVFPENRAGLLYKGGFASKNNERTNTLGFGIKDEKFDMALLYSQRRGQEMKSLGNGADINGAARGIPDPSNHRNHNYLAKIGYLFNENHRVSASYSGQQHHNDTDEKSYNLYGGAWRNSIDTIKRDTLNLAYEYFPVNNAILGYLKAEYDWQKTRVGSINYKGSGEVKTVDNIDNRNMFTRFNRATLRLDSVQFDTGFGQHQFTFKTAYSENKFWNFNTDIVGVGQSYQTPYQYTIQHPIHTKKFYASLQDKVMWNEKWSSNGGIRYDYNKITPQELNARCYACSKTVPKGVVFESLTGNLGLDYQINDVWKVAYNLSTGYRTPSSTEMFFTYEHPAGNWLANPKLNAETSLNNALTLQADSLLGNFAIHGYQTNYKNFLYERETYAWKEDPNCDLRCSDSQRYYQTLFQQGINIDRARIRGIEVRAKLNLDQVFSAVKQGWNITGALGYSKGKFYDTDESMLSIQPVKVILGLGYDDPQDKWGLQSRWTYLGAKKARDAQVITYYYSREGGTKDFPYRNGSAVLFDVFGFVKVNKNITLRAGAYNLFNRKYHTWDSLRGIPLYASTTNKVDSELKGLERFYAPGRNFAGSVEVRF